MIRPTGHPEWAMSPTNITEPLSAEKRSGWGINEQPPSSYFNWWQSLVSKYVKYLDWTPIIEDHFVYGSGASGRFTASGMDMLPWMPEPGLANGAYVVHYGKAGNIFAGGTDPEPEAYARSVGLRGAISLIGLNAANTIAGFSIRDPGAMQNDDWRMEFDFVMATRGCSGSWLSLGADTAQFVATNFGASFAGATGGFSGLSFPLVFMFTPSGGSPTHIPMGVSSIPSGHVKLTAEREGSTMAFYMGQTLMAAAPGVAPEFMTRFGPRYYGVIDGSVKPSKTIIDYIALKVRGQ